MGDVNLEIKLSNLDERVIKIEESGGSGGDGYITSVSNDFNVVNKKLSLSNDVTTKLSKIPTDNGNTNQVLTSNGDGTASWKDAQGGGTAKDIGYDNSKSGLTSTDVQGAIDEVSKEMVDLETWADISGNTSFDGRYVSDASKIKIYHNEKQKHIRIMGYITLIKSNITQSTYYNLKGFNFSSIPQNTQDISISAFCSNSIVNAYLANGGELVVFFANPLSSQSGEPSLMINVEYYY